MENVNKIKLKIDDIKSDNSVINIPFGLDFYPIDNTELQKSEFVDKEKEKSINPIFDGEKYPFYPVYTSNNNDILEIKYNLQNNDGTQLNLNFLGLTDDDIKYRRNPFLRTYLRINFYDSDDTKVQNLVNREIIHIHPNDDWYVNGKLKDQSTIPLTFVTNFNQIFSKSIYGEGYKFYWYKSLLPKILYMRISLMNAKNGVITNLYSNIINGLDNQHILYYRYNYIMSNFFEDQTKKEIFYYRLNDNNQSNIVPDSNVNNKITINLNLF